MLNFIKKLLNNNGIEFAEAISIDSCKIINERLFLRSTGFAKSLVVFLIPYRTEHVPVPHNISAYAAPHDYHRYTAELFKDICGTLADEFPNNRFAGMSDHSPIDEIHAAAAVGLGVIGDNGCLINNKYGSYVFIGEIYTDLELKYDSSREPEHCISCGKCRQACPYRLKDSCLSSVTQKKEELTEDEIELIKCRNTVWGCDVCQEVCPMNSNKEFSRLEYFKADLIYNLDSASLASMNDDEFKTRAYSWRKRSVIERNLKAVESKN